MSEDEAKKDPEWPPLPSVYEIPQEAIEKWAALEDGRPLQVPFGKTQLDFLLLSIQQSLTSQLALGEALRQLTMSDLSAAQKAFRDHQEIARFAYSNINHFIEHVMAHAEISGGDNG